MTVTAKHVFTITPDHAFLDALADGLWQRAGEDIFALTRYLILLPNRRSARVLREAFLRRLKAKAALLPRMQPLGDIDEEEFYFNEGAALAATIPPAITPLRRQLLLTQLVAAKDASMPLDQAAQLAQALAQLIDQVQIERLDFSGLPTLVERIDLAEHWQKTVAFLEIITDAWPKMLAEQGLIDPADRRNRLLEAQAAAWRAAPPDFPVIAAGSTGTMSATRDLLGVIAGLPQAAVILPGLDCDLDENAWQKIGDTHPQYALKELLSSFKLDRTDVKPWNVAKPLRASRVRLLQESMRPADASDGWRHLDVKKIPETVVKGMTRVEVGHPQEEAQVIALAMRQALETKGKTAMLVTPDRMLAERVTAMLARWGVTANDSAGASLASQPVGVYLIDLLRVCAPRASSVDLLSLLKHPFAAFGMAPAVCRAMARRIEIDVWRAQHPAPSDELQALRQKLENFAEGWSKPLSLRERIKRHVDMAEALAASDQEDGKARLWQGEAGETAATWFDDWRAAADTFPPLNGSDYAALFAGLLKAAVFRPSYGQHPRLTILGTLEARLLQADMVILGGLNEGVWPPEAPVDPWMSRPMKAKFKLPPLERRIAFAAHDFVQLASAPEVLLTRSKRAGNAPTVASRFVLQLETVLKALGYSDAQKDALCCDEPWAEWAQLLDRPAAIVPMPRPEPRPPAASRPNMLSVTKIGTWRRNPYAIYAEYVLGLKKLESLEAELDAADRGSIIHEALDQFVRAYPDTLPQDGLAKLLDIGRKIFADYDEQPNIKAFWWPRFERIAGWFINEESARRTAGVTVVDMEAKGRMSMDGFTLKGRADRIDALPEGGIAIIDYKTGARPTDKAVKAGYEPQLPLLGLIAEGGGFTKTGKASVAELAYWKLSGGRTVAEKHALPMKPDELIREAKAGLEALIKTFADPQTPYLAAPKPRHMPRYDDYAHLARLAEWGRTEEDAS